MSKTTPFTCDVDATTSRMSRFDNHIERRLSQMRGQYSQPEAYEALLAVDDVLVYEVYETIRPGARPARSATGSPCSIRERWATSTS